MSFAGVEVHNGQAADVDYGLVERLRDAVDVHHLESGQHGQPTAKEICQFALLACFINVSLLYQRQLALFACNFSRHSLVGKRGKGDGCLVSDPTKVLDTGRCQYGCHDPQLQRTAKAEESKLPILLLNHRLHGRNGLWKRRDKAVVHVVDLQGHAGIYVEQDESRQHRAPVSYRVYCENSFNIGTHVHAFIVRVVHGGFGFLESESGWLGGSGTPWVMKYQKIL
jgi:hypothetical protein